MVPLHSAQAALQLAVQTAASVSTAARSVVATSLVLPAVVQVPLQVPVPVAKLAAQVWAAHLVQLATALGARHSAQVAWQAVQESAVWVAAILVLAALVVAAWVPSALPPTIPFPEEHLVQVPVLAEVKESQYPGLQSKQAVVAPEAPSMHMLQPVGAVPAQVIASFSPVKTGAAVARIARMKMTVFI